MTDAARDAFYKKTRESFPFFCANLLKIKIKRPERFQVFQRDKADTLIFDASDTGSERIDYFRWNIAQQIVWNIMVQQFRAGMSFDLIICKARQFGISTFFCAWLFWNMWRSMHVNAAIAAQRKDTIQLLIETNNTFYENLPPELQPQLRSTKTNRRVNKDDMYFEDRKCSLVGVVAKGEPLRGPNIDLALCTEVVEYDDPINFFGSFVPAMNPSPFKTVVLESTPKDGYFRHRYMKAKEGGPSKAIFLPWWIRPDLYSLPLTPGTKGKHRQRVLRNSQSELVTFSSEERSEQRSLNLEVARYNDEHGLHLPGITDEQMYWRQCQIELMEEDIEFFNQEYPRDDVTCFQKASRSAFTIVMPQVNASVESAEEPEFIALDCTDYYRPGHPHITPVVNRKRTYAQIEQRPERYGRHVEMAVWCRPVPEHIYCLGVDVAGDHDVDIEDIEGTEQHAYSVVSVYDTRTFEQCAEWRGTCRPSELGDVAVIMGYWYNTGMINVEVNGIGLTCKDRIEQYLMYPNLFMWPDFDTAGARLSKKSMWETNRKSKPIMIDRFITAIQMGLYRPYSRILRSEMQDYILKDGLYMTDNNTADCLMAAALAYMCVVFNLQHLQPREGKFVGAAVTQDREIAALPRASDFISAGYRADDGTHPGLSEWPSYEGLSSTTQEHRTIVSPSDILRGHHDGFFDL